MESKKTTELRKRKGSIKAKLMAAVAMLLVSTIMLSSTTYAWFILSTAPEVTGMTTTVGSNGSLEIALLNDQTGADTGLITAKVGDSVASKDVEVANESWGNIVSLSSTNYGLGNVTLYPSALNMASTTTFANRYMLSVPVYGVDGRVAELSADEVVAGKLDTAENVFVDNANAYGVRAIGTSGDVDPVAMALANAQTAYTLAMDGAQTAAGRALNGPNNNGSNAMALMKLIMKDKIAEVGDTSSSLGYNIDVEIEPTDKVALGTIVTYLTESLQYAEVALKAYAAGYEASQGNIKTADEIVLSNYTAVLGDYIDALDDLKADVAAAQAAYNTAYGTNGTDGSDEYSAVLDAMIDLEKTDVADADGNRKPLSQYGKDELTVLMALPTIYVMDGLLSDVANFVDDYSSKQFSFDTTVNNIGVTSATMVATPNADVDPAYLVELKTGESDPTGIMNMTIGESGEGAAVVAIATTYGYIVDLAFRASVDTSLLLSDAVQRVSSSEETTTMGSGSTFTVSTESTDGLDALRLVFVNGANEIIGVAAPVATETTGVYDLHMFDYTVTVGANGTSLALGTQKATDEIVALQADEPTKLSVLVYLDGDEVDSAMSTTSGTLNLQFASSETLTAMNYAGYVATTNNGGTGNDEGSGT